MGQLTPMLRQYMEIKAEYPEEILFFRMGDFYEMFFDDALEASRVLGITLTSRGTYNGEKVPMCGIPHHASRSYLAKLVKGGIKVAICEQVEDPKEAKGIVKREVIRLVTPGSLIEEGGVDEDRNLYMACVAEQGGRYGISHADLSTGDFSVTEAESRDDLLDELGRIDPAELLLSRRSNTDLGDEIGGYHIEYLEDDCFDFSNSEEILKEQLGARSLAGFGCENMPLAIVAAGVIARYLRDTQKEAPVHIKELRSYGIGEYMFLDEATLSHLELLKTMRRHSVKGSLCHVLDSTVTPMGGRLLRRWIVYPLVDLSQIRNRLAAVAWLKDDPPLREKLREMLGKIYDLERLNGRISMGRSNARDLIALKNSLLMLPEIKSTLEQSASKLVSGLAESLDTLDDVAELIGEAIAEDPPVTIKEGGIVKEGYDDRLDELIALSRDGKGWIKNFAAQEQKRSGISNLKVGYNKVFGYYIEVSKSNQHLVPEDYIRKQTLVNGERYITEALKEKEDVVLGAEEKRARLELEIFERVRARIAVENKRIRQSADIIARLDVLSGLAERAEANDYVCPEVNVDSSIVISGGRHPVIEKTVKEEDFVPNDITLDSSDQQVLIITGPNMAGKSTILRQTALTVLMAQMGSFVPASAAVIGLVDRIFTRVGASDDLARGQSTFMVEMNEAANILRNATPRSLVVLDEIGRGTSTYDGLSIAWAVAEALHDREERGVRTLFATHYHELTELVSSKPRVKNFNIAVREWKGRIIFLRKLVPGGTSRSYGIQVARIAGLPEDVLKRAEEILEGLEEERERSIPSEHLDSTQDTGLSQLSLFNQKDSRLAEWIGSLDVSSMTPVEAIVELERLKRHVLGGK